MRSTLLIGSGLITISLVGIALVVVTSGHQRSEPAPSSPKESVGRTATTTNTGRTTSLSKERQTRALRRPQKQRGGSREESSAATHAQTQRQLSTAFEASEQKRFIQEFAREDTATAFADHWEPILAANLDSALQNAPGLAESSIECRESRCLAEVEWEDYPSAQAQLAPLARAGRGQCATLVFLPPPDDPNTTYHHKVRFHHCIDSEHL